jgi:hypothetical protein
LLKQPTLATPRLGRDLLLSPMIGAAARPLGGALHAFEATAAAALAEPTGVLCGAHRNLPKTNAPTKNPIAIQQRDQVSPVIQSGSYRWLDSGSGGGLTGG